jgi:quercetin dioxygenase-like cupin family protein
MTSKLIAPVLAGWIATGTAWAAPDGVHPIQVAPPSSEGVPREVSVILDLPTVKIVAITLRGGTPLAEHTAPNPVTIQAAHGDARITVAGVDAPLAAGQFVVLDAGTPHAVTPAGTAPVTVLVHHHKAGAT